MANSSWKTILCKRSNLDLDTVLSCGQSFTWKKAANGVWSNVIRRQLYSLYQSPECIWWCTGSHDDFIYDEKNSSEYDANSGKGVLLTDPANETTLESENSIADMGEKESDADDKDFAFKESEQVLRKYLALDIDLESLYARWSDADPHFAKIAKSFVGIRMLQQDPTENLFSFICSSNNHISRIGSMVHKLSTNFGEKVGSVYGTDFHVFPQPKQLSGPDVEGKLRALGFGYR